MSVDGTLTNTRRIEVRLFAGARERAGRESVEITLPQNATIHDARQSLGKTAPALTDQLPYLLFAIGTEYANNEDAIPENCELAAFPPVSGG